MINRFIKIFFDKPLPIAEMKEITKNNIDRVKKLEDATINGDDKWFLECVEIDSPKIVKKKLRLKCVKAGG